MTNCLLVGSTAYCCFGFGSLDGISTRIGYKCCAKMGPFWATSNPSIIVKSELALIAFPTFLSCDPLFAWSRFRSCFLHKRNVPSKPCTFQGGSGQDSTVIYSDTFVVCRRSRWRNRDQPKQLGLRFSSVSQDSLPASSGCSSCFLH